DLGAPGLPVQLQRYQCVTGAFDGTHQPVDLCPVQQQFAQPRRVGDHVCGGRVQRRDVRPLQENLATADDDVTLGQLRAAGTHGLHFPSGQRNAGLETFFDEIFVPRPAVLGDQRVGVGLGGFGHALLCGMRHIRRSALVATSPQRMFELINDIEHYPDFVPACTAARVLERSADELHAELTVGTGLLKTTFSTRNRLHPPERIDMQLESGPLKSLNGRWTLMPVAAGDVSGCRVELDLTFEPQGGLAAMALAPVVERLASSLVDAFV